MEISRQLPMADGRGCRLGRDLTIVPSPAVMIIGHMDRALLEQLLREGVSLEEIGRRFGRHESTVSYWLKKYGLKAAHREKHAARGPLSRERLADLVAAGCSGRDIAAAVDRSPTTVRHWLDRYELETASLLGRPARAEVREALAAGLVVARLVCHRHGPTEFRLQPGRGYRCRRCRSEAVTRRRQRTKQMLVQEAGGACAACGYDECPAALHFHHLEPAEKAFALSHRGVCRSAERARREAQKCVLLCSNCHAEVEAGIRVLEPRPPP